MYEPYYKSVKYDVSHPENMPKRWAVDVVAKEVKDHDQATASSPTAAELSEGTLDELTEKLSEKDNKEA